MNSMPDEFILALVNMCIEGGTPLQPAQIDRLIAGRRDPRFGYGPGAAVAVAGPGESAAGD